MSSKIKQGTVRDVHYRGACRCASNTYLQLIVGRQPEPHRSQHCTGVALFTIFA